MKKIILIAGGIILSAASFAQLRLGVQVTSNLASANVKSKYDIDFNKSLASLPGVSVVVQYDLGRHLSLRSGVTYLKQGVKLKHAEDEFGSTTTTTRLNYLQVPVHVIYNVNVGGTRLYAGLGGYGAYGISGEVKNTLWFYTDDGGYDFTEKLKAFKKSEEDGGNFQRKDYGLSALAGVQLRNGLFIQAGYQQGLTNISRDKEDRYRNKGAQLSIGYFF